jgi:hypothetical protein
VLSFGRDESFKDKKLFVDAEKIGTSFFFTFFIYLCQGNSLRYAAHSCSPNCTFVQVIWKGDLAMGACTLRDLAPNEEITVDYAWDWEEGDPILWCHCGSPACCKVMNPPRSFWSKKRKTRYLKALELGLFNLLALFHCL